VVICPDYRKHRAPDRIGCSSCCLSYLGQGFLKQHYEAGYSDKKTCNPKYKGREDSFPAFIFLKIIQPVQVLRVLHFDDIEIDLYTSSGSSTSKDYVYKSIIISMQ
jgi:hypothetical protein